MGIFRKKVEFEGDKFPVSNGVKFIIAVIFIVGMFIGAYAITEWAEKSDIKYNNLTEYVEDM